MPFNPEIHHRHSIRLRDYDYSNAGAYFVTICAFQRECFFGEIYDGNFIGNEAGKITKDTWMDIPQRFSTVSLDEFVVMPNHFHGILLFADVSDTSGNGEEIKSDAAGRMGAASGAPTLGNVVRAFKSISAIAVNKTTGRKGTPLWQRNYYERVIRNEQELEALRLYISANPAQWENDENHPSKSGRRLLRPDFTE
jgi:REP element-mobilizing transposase RayT